MTKKEAKIVRDLIDLIESVRAKHDIEYCTCHECDMLDEAITDAENILEPKKKGLAKKKQ